jgi:flagellar protein FliJ
MNSRDTLARLRRFQIDETNRRVAQLETMIAEFSKMARELEREISAEELTARLETARRFLEEVLASPGKPRGSQDNGTAQLAG